MKVDMTAAAESPQDSGQLIPGEVSQTQPSNAVAVRQNMAPSTYIQDGEMEGEFDQNDYERARLVIVGATGILSTQFTPGDMLFNKEFVIGDKKTPLTVIPVGCQKLYQNDLDYEGDEMGDTVKSATEVLERGGIVDYRPYEDKSSKHYWKRIAKVLFLVKCPANISPDAAMLFPFEIEGADYGLAGFWASSKTAYSGVAIPIIQSKQKGSIRRNTYRLTTAGKQSTDGKRTWIQTNIRAVGPTNEAILKFIAENVS